MMPQELQQLRSMISQIKNPQEFVMNALKQNSNPILNGLVEELQKGNTQAVYNFANNFYKDRGVNLNDLLQFFR